MPVSRSLRPSVLALHALAAAALAGCGDDSSDPFPRDVREACAQRSAERNVLFGDLHVHTRFSFDAYLNEVRSTPADAYRFAKGETLALPPLDGEGRGTIPVTIDRPLDFAAVTDHSEYLGEIDACTDPTSPIYDDRLCVRFRTVPVSSLVDFGVRLNQELPVRFPVCAAFDCVGRARDAWRRLQEAAEAAYDRTSDCTFTSFVGYEWSSALNLSNLHRNVLFRSARVPAAPTSYFEESDPTRLWARLREDCLEGIPGCDVLAIPHNSNWSNGRMFLAEPAPGTDEAAAARERARMEPLLEIFQHKGDSECTRGLDGVLGPADELCDFEKLRDPPFTDCGEGGGMGGTINLGCLSQRDFLRGILLEGLREEARIGVNPWPLGVIASTDTHNATPGAVSEEAYVGHFGLLETDLYSRLTVEVPGGPRSNPGGLVAVWAEENSRDAIFDALRRKETYGTSGPRIAVRTFAGWDLPQDLCARPDLVATGYAEGVPMGGALPPRPGAAAAPRLVVLALQDPGTPRSPGRPLERIQIVKGAVDATGQARVDVFDVAGEAGVGGVDPTTCAPSPGGAERLCAVWTDPSFDPEARAFYYARVLETPRCRWSAYSCDAIPEDDASEAATAARLRCARLPRTIQERAWTSPIFVSPAD